MGAIAASARKELAWFMRHLLCRLRQSSSAGQQSAPWWARGRFFVGCLAAVDALTFCCYTARKDANALKRNASPMCPPFLPPGFFAFTAPRTSNLVLLWWLVPPFVVHPHAGLGESPLSPSLARRARTPFNCPSVRHRGWIHVSLGSPRRRHPPLDGCVSRLVSQLATCLSGNWSTRRPGMGALSLPSISSILVPNAALAVGMCLVPFLWIFGSGLVLSVACAMIGT